MIALARAAVSGVNAGVASTGLARIALKRMGRFPGLMPESPPRIV